MHLSSTETAVFIGAVPALLGAGIGAWLTGLQQRRSEAKADRDRLRSDTTELVAACGDLMLALEALRLRHQTRSAKYHRGLKVIFDIAARIDPGAWTDWTAARDNALPAAAGAGSELITADRAEIREAALASTPAMARIFLAVAGIRSAGDEQFQNQLSNLMDATTGLSAAYPKKRRWDKAVTRLNAEIGAMNKEVDRLTQRQRRRINLAPINRRHTAPR